MLEKRRLSRKACIETNTKLVDIATMRLHTDAVVCYHGSSSSNDPSSDYTFNFFPYFGQEGHYECDGAG